MKKFMGFLAMAAFAVIFTTTVQAQQTATGDAGATFNGNFGTTTIGSFGAGTGSAAFNGQDPIYTAGVAGATGAGSGSSSTKTVGDLNSGVSSGNATLGVEAGVTSGSGASAVITGGTAQAGNWLTIGGETIGASGGSLMSGSFQQNLTGLGPVSATGTADADNSAAGWTKSSSNSASAGINVVGASDGNTTVAGTLVEPSTTQTSVTGNGVGAAESIVGDPSSTTNNYAGGIVSGTAGLNGSSTTDDVAGVLGICGKTAGSVGTGVVSASAIMQSYAGIQTTTPVAGTPLPQPSPCTTGSTCGSGH